ncbi:MAG: hypothetical protein NW202_13310 [Nitrospira sp.]|nr:hypothetical protein [Nitrospira sp.]
MSNQWIPPGMRVCTWDEAMESPRNSGARVGIHKDGTFPTDFGPDRTGVTWLCIDTQKPQHAHEDKPWVRHGFEECSGAEAPRGYDGEAIAITAMGNYVTTAAEVCATFLRPSPLFGLKRALEILTGEVGNDWTCNIIRAEIAKYEPPVCGECGRVK